MTNESKRTGTPNRTLGWRFFGAICAALVALVLAYVGLHLRFPPAASRMSLTLAALISRAEEQGRSATKISANSDLSVTMDEVKRLTNILLANSSIGLQPDERENLTALINNLEGAIKRDDQPEFLARLAVLKRLFETLIPNGFFWDQEPLRFLEILLWSIAGVLIHQIITCARYLRYDNVSSG
jgi:hypothetical protein